MLANLDNEVHFKKVFTDIDVYTAFVNNVLGIDEEMIAYIEDSARKSVTDESIKKVLRRRKLSFEEIAEDFEVPLQHVLHLNNQMTKS
jgi:hypothetical protein